MKQAIQFIVKKDNKIVLEIRPLTKKYGAGKIAVPGGKIERGETPEKALFREIHEELGIKPQNFKLIYTCIDEEDQPEIYELFYYLITKWEGEIKQKDIGELIFEDLQFVDKILPYQADKDAIKKIQELLKL